ncbi:hypothetical protein BDV28DRAFT_151308 [Aspergillus coremiiformis]|uniref:Uncharacterized protein n=1 Tax=Aspergillus coremiiformis TaxID=138285 RepID=A0A5N6YX92_9EURO|nr:hypothetical protein BDV28DRAFT_151308 [Aspergillus coremiiformis]
MRDWARPSIVKFYIQSLPYLYRWDSSINEPAPHIISAQITPINSEYPNQTHQHFPSSIMKSPLYILTVLLPLAVQVAQATPTPDADELEDRATEERRSCRVRHGFDYWKYPCGSSDTSGRAHRGDNITLMCRYKYVSVNDTFG